MKNTVQNKEGKMLGGKNRDYKTSDRAIRAKILIHLELTKEIQESAGIKREEASKHAYKMILEADKNPGVRDRIRSKVVELKEV